MMQILLHQTFHIRGTLVAIKGVGYDYCNTEY